MNRVSESRARRLAAAIVRHPLIGACSVVALLVIMWVAYLNWQITTRFEGRRWDLPAHVYARPLELYVGLPLSIEAFEDEIARLGYRHESLKPTEPGAFRRLGARFELVTRPFRFWDGLQRERFLSLEFESGAVARLRDDREDIPLARLEPLMIGSLFAAHGEDRLVVSPDEVPRLLPEALVSVEDRRFEEHIGIDPAALGRAFIANLRAGAITQGGSTLTQQLVKNYFLDNRRTLVRKVREAATAIILETHYDKTELMNAYINEVYMGQDGSRAIHGFGLASRFYFSRPLDELELHEIALLVALVRGPGYYDPYRHPDRAIERRNMVLRQMVETDVIERSTADEASSLPLDLWDRGAHGASYYPGYLQLVRRQLAQQYRNEDLTQEDLRVFTALDPRAQGLAERRLAEGLDVLEPASGDVAPSLSGAVVIASVTSGEVLAVVGDRKRSFGGFNRALDARRPIGSLVKPAVYLAAIQSGMYTLASTIADDAVSVTLENGDTWAPQNFDKKSHGEVSLLRALSESLNLATVRLGLDVGLARVAETLQQLGFDGAVNLYPSLLLGAVEMSPMEVTGMFGTLARGGFKTPNRAVRSVVDGRGEPLTRYPIEVSQTLDPAAVYQLNQGLVEVMRHGTGQAARGRLPPDLAVAGKSGTSDGLRDNWFAGFTGAHVIVVWIGYDDNRPTGFTGAVGALPVWAGIVSGLDSAAYAPSPPPGFDSRWIQYETGLEVSRTCRDAIRLALPPTVELSRGPRCGIDVRQLTERTADWLRDLVH